MKQVVLVLACAALCGAANGVEFGLGVGAYEGRAAFRELRITDAEGKVVYSNAFATPDAVKGWIPAGRGAWKCGGGTLEQSFGGLGHEAATVLSGASTDDYNDIGAENRVVPVEASFAVNDGRVSLPPHSVSFITIIASAD